MIKRSGIYFYGSMFLVGALLWCVGKVATLPHTQAAETITIDAEVEVVPEAGRMASRKERRAMGVTFRGVRQAVNELQASGELSPDPGMASVQVMAVLQGDNPKAFQDAAVAEIDWDELLSFIERLIALIMALFS